MKKLFPLLILALLLAACQPTPATPSAPTVDFSTETPVPVESTLAPADVFATAIAAGEATQAAGPTAEPTNTPKPAPTIDPNRNYWWNNVVFYEIFVRSFYDSDGDGIGDINGLIEKLDYLNDGNPNTTDDLGIKGIWLMPIMESPSYHGYDVTDYYKVNPDYGTNDDFKRLMDEAHKRGIYVIVDLVLNHTSTQHPWFVESKDPNSPYRDWYLWSDSYQDYVGPWGQKVWHPSNGSYYYGVFWDGMPDLNLQNPIVTNQIENVTRFWLDNMGVDGFRFDAIKHFIEDGSAQENTNFTHDWLTEYNAFYKSVDADAFSVGEAWTSTNELLDYTGDEMDVVFAFDLAEAFLDAASGTNAEAAATYTAQMVDNFPQNQYATFLANHDQNRTMSQMIGNVDFAKMAATIQLTSPGVPFIYYGEEIGMTGVKPDEDIRLPMQWNGNTVKAGFTSGTPWRAPSPDTPTFNVASQNNDPDSLLNHYRDLIHLRNTHPALLNGDWVQVESGSKQVYAFMRRSADEQILVVINASRNAVNRSDYALTLTNGTLPTGVRPVSLLGEANPAEISINANGGFDAYIPFSVIPGKGFGIIQLAP